MAHRLVLVRHAKTESAAASDAVRELTERGERQSAALGDVLDGLVRGNVHASVSSAVRAVQTWRLAAARIETDVTSEQFDSLYIADVDDLLTHIRAADDGIDTLVVVGHNPTIADVVERLADGGVGPVYDALRAGGYSPSTTTVFDVGHAWAHLDSTTADLVEYVPPRA